MPSTLAAWACGLANRDSGVGWVARAGKIADINGRLGRAVKIVNLGLIAGFFVKGLDEIETERRARRLDAARAEFQRRQGRDIEQVEDLVRVPPAVLRRLPPEPHGWEWVLDADSGQIVSSYVGHRYRLRIDRTNQMLLERFRARSREKRRET